MTAAVQTEAQPQAQTQPQALRSNLIAQVVQNLLLFLLFAGLASSRAEGHVLSASALAGIVIVASATSAVLAWTTSLYSGAFSVLTGAVAADEDTTYTGSDPFAGRTMWRTTLGWALGAAAWAGAGAGIVAAALNGRVARFATVYVVMVALAGVNLIAISSAARRRGLAAAHLPATTTVPLRRRAWRGVALPYALSQGALNAGVAWLLFHDYATGANAVSANVLTEKVVLADAMAIVIPLAILFGGMTRFMGAFDIATNRVAYDDPETQTIPKRSPIGMQFAVYTIVLGLIFFRLAGYVLPSYPSLTQVIVVRAVITTVLVFIAAGIGYVRGAANGLKDSEVPK